MKDVYEGDLDLGYEGDFDPEEAFKELDQILADTNTQVETTE